MQRAKSSGWNVYGTHCGLESDREIISCDQIQPPDNPSIIVLGKVSFSVKSIFNIRRSQEILSVKKIRHKDKALSLFTDLIGKKTKARDFLPTNFLPTNFLPTR